MKSQLSRGLLAILLLLSASVASGNPYNGGGPYNNNGGGNGIGATSLGPCLTNTGGQLNTTQDPNDQTGTSYTIQQGDACKNISLNNAGATALTLPPVTTTGFGVGYGVTLKNLGVGLVTVTSISNINATTTYLLYPGESVNILTNQGGNAYETTLNTPFYFMRNVGLMTTSPSQALDLLGTGTGANTTEFLLENQTNSGGGFSGSPRLFFLGKNWNSSNGNQTMNAYIDEEAYSSNTTPEVDAIDFWVSSQFGVLPTIPSMYITGQGQFGVAGGAFFNSPVGPAAYLFGVNDINLWTNGTVSNTVPIPSNKIVQYGQAWNSGIGAIQEGVYSQININSNNASPVVSRLGWWLQDGTGYGTTYKEQIAIYNQGGISIGNGVVTTPPPTNGILSQSDIIINTAGNGLQLKSGSNARIGTGTLSSGTVTIANTSVTSKTEVFLTDTTATITNLGTLTVTISAGTGFTVKSSNVLDTSTFNWMLVEAN